MRHVTAQRHASLAAGHAGGREIDRFIKPVGTVIAGCRQHFEIPFSPLDLELAATKDGTKYYLVLYATLNTGESVTLAQTELEIVRDNVPDNDVLPVQAGNLVGEGAVYDGGGHYAITGLAAGKALRWSKGANDTSVTNGGDTINVSGQNFFTHGATITLNGTAGEPVTAVVWNAPFFTADEVAALMATALAEAGGYSGTGSPEGVVTSIPGKTYFDTTNGDEHFWAKKTGIGNTGWFQIF